MVEGFEQNVRQAFLKVKEDIQVLKNSQEKQTQENKQICEKLNEILEKIKGLETKTKITKSDSSIGNEGANQSINHPINQSINHQSSNHEELTEIASNSVKTYFNEENKPNQSSNQSITNQSINQSRAQFNQMEEKEQPMKAIAKDINTIFSTLTKQELKLFLTIYQLEDDGLEANYKAVSHKMQLSEHCIRSHLSSLFRKNIPLTKSRMGNKLNLLSVRKEFRALNLKQRLINLYYDSDPHQKTLLNL